MNKIQVNKKIWPVEYLLIAYNIFIVFFIFVNIRRVSDGFILIGFHLLGLFIYSGLIYFRKEKYRFFNLFMLLMPVIVTSLLHYETGLINRLIIPEFQDAAVIKLDQMIFRSQPYTFLSKILNHEFFRQLFHSAYFSYYILLTFPLIYFWLKSKTDKGYFEKAQQMLFGFMLAMFGCYAIFLVYPVAGPTVLHPELFPEPKGMVWVMDFLYLKGDLDGGAVPSSHVAVSLVAIIYICRFIPKIRWLVIIDFILLAISTVYNCYHYASDVIGGLIAGVLFYNVAEKLYRKYFSKDLFSFSDNTA